MAKLATLVLPIIPDDAEPDAEKKMLTWESWLSQPDKLLGECAIAAACSLSRPSALSFDPIRAYFHDSLLFHSVVDIHKAWCGPCTVMKPTFRNIYLSLDDSENRLQFLTADSSKIAAFAEFDEDPSCQPLFKFYKVGRADDAIRLLTAPCLTLSACDGTALEWQGDRGVHYQRAKCTQGQHLRRGARPAV